MVSTEENLLNTLMKEDDITWQQMIYELVQTQQMDPWDVNISSLSSQFLTVLNNMREANLKVSGKVVLAAAILLRLKSGQFIDIDLANLEKLIAADQGYDGEFLEPGEAATYVDPETGKRYQIFPRTPQPRKRKVSVYDLVTALEKVLEGQQRKMNARRPAPQVAVNMKRFDINVVMKNVFEDLNTKCAGDKTQLKFSELLASNDKSAIVATFIPLLHLTNQRVTDLNQEKPFDDFDVVLLKKGLSFEDLGKIHPE